MSNTPPIKAELPVYGETACGARIKINPDTPYAHFHEQIVYFCGWDCKQLFEEKPASSCMASRLTSDH